MKRVTASFGNVGGGQDTRVDENVRTRTKTRKPRGNIGAWKKGAFALMSLANNAQKKGPSTQRSREKCWGKRQERKGERGLGKCYEVFTEGVRLFVLQYSSQKNAPRDCIVPRDFPALSPFAPCESGGHPHLNQSEAD